MALPSRACGLPGCSSSARANRCAAPGRSRSYRSSANPSEQCASAAVSSDSPLGVPSVYIAAAEGATGKSTVAMGVLRLLVASVPRVGVFRPVRRSNGESDLLLELMLEHATARLDDYDRCLGVTYDRVHEDPAAALSEIVAHYHEVARQCDAVVIIATPHQSDQKVICLKPMMPFSGRMSPRWIMSGARRA